jgi:hypothetical protein
MDLSFSSLMAGLTFGSMGFYFIKRGKQKAEPRVALLGAVLLVFPYFLENIYLVWALGVGLIFLGFKL